MVLTEDFHRLFVQFEAFVQPADILRARPPALEIDELVHRLQRRLMAPRFLKGPGEVRDDFSVVGKPVADLFEMLQRFGEFPLFQQNFPVKILPLGPVGMFRHVFFQLHQRCVEVSRIPEGLRRVHPELRVRRVRPEKAGMVFPALLPAAGPVTDFPHDPETLPVVGFLLQNGGGLLLRIPIVPQGRQRAGVLQPQFAVLRIVGHQEVQVFQNLVGGLPLFQNLPQIGRRHRVIGSAFQGAPEGLHRFPGSTLLSEDGGHVVVSCGVFRIQGEDFPEGGGGLVEFFPPLQHDAQVVQTIDPARAGADRKLELLLRILQVSQALLGDAEIVAQGRVVRVRAEPPVEDLRGLPEIAHLLVQGPQVVVGKNEAGIQVQGLGVGRHRMGGFSIELVHVAQVVPHLGGPGVQMNGPLNGSQALFGPADPAVHDSQIVQGFRIVRTQLQSFFELGYRPGIHLLFSVNGAQHDIGGGECGVLADEVFGDFFRRPQVSYSQRLSGLAQEFVAAASLYCRHRHSGATWRAWR